MHIHNEITIDRVPGNIHLTVYVISNPVDLPDLSVTKTTRSESPLEMTSFGNSLPHNVASFGALVSEPS